ncbi:MAG: class I SAM-dependent methyltransferase [Spirochaetales bacterium]|nr:class I SAM-dependent methyltransferase [Spirochaetales bacterium]
MINREYAASFDKVASLYDLGRIGYPEEIYETIDLYTNLNEDSTILEVGCGSGIATQEIYNKWKANIIAIDPGKSLLEIANAKSASNKRIQHVNTDFEHYDSAGPVDAIFSATAFHWTDPEIRYRKSSVLLKNNGFLVLYWNNCGLADGNVFYDIQKMYDQYHPDGNPEKDVRLIQRETIQARKDEIEESGYFALKVHHEYIYSIILNSAEYINLLKSFSNNASKPQQELSRFYDEIYSYIQSMNDRISLKINVNLEIAGKGKSI